MDKSCITINIVQFNNQKTVSTIIIISTDIILFYGTVLLLSLPVFLIPVIIVIAEVF